MGNTNSLNLFQDVEKKHPHTRGEYVLDKKKLKSQEETPPHAWGILPPIDGGDTAHRNTPTRVGNTKPNPEPPPIKWKHPHTRGEYKPKRSGEAIMEETPPHAWGIQTTIDQSRTNSRNTPTRVGNTALVPAAVLQLQKHPHTRGEYSRGFEKMAINI